MNKELTLKELEEYLKPLIHFGKIELKISETKDGKKIEVYEQDEHEYTGENENTVKDGDLTRPFTLYTSKDGEVDFIEHSFRAFTRANKESVIRLISLIGTTIK